MAGNLFRKDIKAETGREWEDWIRVLDEDNAATYSHDGLTAYLQEVHTASDKWAPLIAAMYGQKLGRKPVGQTAAVGFNIGVRKTAAIPKERIWSYLLSPAGLKLWIGDIFSLPLVVGSEFKSNDGTTGKLGVVKPYEKLRMSWQRKDWDKPSTLQIYLLSPSKGKTTVSFHQEKLEDLYMREMMRLHWEKTLDTLLQETTKERDL